MYLPERGATLVEFTLGSFIFFGLIGLIVDFSLGYHRYSLLTDMTKEVARRAAIDLVRHNGEVCSDLEDLVKNEIAKPYFEEELDLDSPYMRPYDEVTNPTGIRFGARVDLCDSQRKVIVKGRMDFQCFFCMFLNRPFPITTTSRIPIEFRGSVSNQFDCLIFDSGECPDLNVNL